MRESITEALQAESVSIVDTYGDGRHVSIDVVSSQFEGKSSVKRQQAVYKAIWLELQETVHAVDAMTTKTPAEAAS
jgi:stress-induced morphogen